MKDLAEHVTMKKPQFVKVITGPKDAGKSTGIVKLIYKWKELGHIIVDYVLYKNQYATPHSRPTRTVSFC